MFRKSFYVLLMLITTQSAHSFITVANGGVGGGCDFTNILDAYDEAIATNDREIRVTTDLVLPHHLLIDSFINIKGGYDDCAAANAGTVGSNLSQWSGGNQNTVIEVNIASGFNIVMIENFRIYNGKNIAFAGAGGMYIHGNSAVFLNNVIVEDNEGNEGGGIRVTGNNAYVKLTESKVRSNIADFGAGVYCESGATLEITANSAINSNNASNDGGGIYGNNDCLINAYTGSVASGFGATSGIYANQADFGAGVYLKGGADLNLTGDDNHPASIDVNFAGTTGGAIFMTGAGTVVTAINAKIINNFATFGGAAFIVADNARLTMSRLDSTCWNNDECSIIANNFVTHATNNSKAAVAYIDGNSLVNISQTKIDNNKAKTFALFTIEDSIATLEGNLITHNKKYNSADPVNNLFELRDYATLNFHYNTLTENNTDGIFNLGLATVHDLNIYNSLILDSGDILNYTDNSGASIPHQSEIYLNCNLVHETTSLNSASSVIFTGTTNNPVFEDVGNNDYHLIEFSSAIDRCNESVIESFHKDLNANSRGNDITTFGDFVGPYDAGAYEYYDSDIIFTNGFE